MVRSKKGTAEISSVVVPRGIGRVQSQKQRTVGHPLSLEVCPHRRYVQNVLPVVSVLLIGDGKKMRGARRTAWPVGAGALPGTPSERGPPACGSGGADRRQRGRLPPRSRRIPLLPAWLRRCPCPPVRGPLGGLRVVPPSPSQVRPGWKPYRKLITSCGWSRCVKIRSGAV